MMYHNYAFYRLPHEDEYTMVAQTSDHVDAYGSIDELGEASGFVVAPFDMGNAPMVCIRPDVVERHACPDVVMGKGIRVDDVAPTPEYKEAFNRFIDSLATGEHEKLVLSRQCVVKIPEGFDTEQTFMRACKAYPRLMIYLVHTNVTGTWLGCTPEILFDGSNNHYHTVALAGTMSLDSVDSSAQLEDYPLSIWNDKNRREQHIVEQYIADCLSGLAENIQIDGPRTVRAGSLLHIKTLFGLNLRFGCSQLMAIERLHPTPAVCGLPKSSAEKFILQNEGTRRDYYSGFIGPMNLDGATHLYVNLRCMKVEDDALRLYAGGGILSSSFLQQEWTETREKMKTILNIL